MSTDLILSIGTANGSQDQFIDELTHIINSIRKTLKLPSHKREYVYLSITNKSIFKNMVGDMITYYRRYDYNELDIIWCNQSVKLIFQRRPLKPTILSPKEMLVDVVINNMNVIEQFKHESAARYLPLHVRHMR